MLTSLLDRFTEVSRAEEAFLADTRYAPLPSDKIPMYDADEEVPSTAEQQPQLLVPDTSQQGKLGSLKRRRRLSKRSIAATNSNASLNAP